MAAHLSLPSPGLWSSAARQRARVETAEERRLRDEATVLQAQARAMAEMRASRVQTRELSWRCPCGVSNGRAREWCRECGDDRAGEP